jgi:CO dehydrogenase/acetyl-CoA synthase delta subunit
VWLTVCRRGLVSIACLRPRQAFTSEPFAWDWEHAVVAAWDWEHAVVAWTWFDTCKCVLLTLTYHQGLLKCVQMGRSRANVRVIECQWRG